MSSQDMAVYLHSLGIALSMILYLLIAARQQSLEVLGSPHSVFSSPSAYSGSVHSGFLLHEPK